MFGLFRKRSEKKNKEKQTAFAFILLPEKYSLHFEEFVAELEHQYNFPIASKHFDLQSNNAILQLADAHVMLMTITVPIPVQWTVALHQTPMGTRAKDVIEKHRAHLAVSVISNHMKPLELYRQLTPIVASALNHCDNLGVYLPAQQLLLPKGLFIQEAKTMKDDTLPLFNWIAFTVVEDEQGNGGYTRGLSAFGHQELEIAHSKRTTTEIREMLFFLCHYIILNQITLRDGETVGFSEEEKIAIRESSSAFSEGSVLKIDY